MDNEELRNRMDNVEKNVLDQNFGIEQAVKQIEMLVSEILYKYNVQFKTTEQHRKDIDKSVWQLDLYKKDIEKSMHKIIEDVNGKDHKLQQSIHKVIERRFIFDLD